MLEGGLPETPAKKGFGAVLCTQWVAMPHVHTTTGLILLAKNVGCQKEAAQNSSLISSDEKKTQLFLSSR